MTRLICIGHRGAAGYEPENTLRSVAEGILLGADWVEVDVFCTEGHLVIIHDDTLNRTTDGTGPVMEHTFNELRALDAGNGERIPTLREVFRLARGRVGLHVELKGPNTAAPVVTFIQKEIAKGDWTYSQIILSAADHTKLDRVHELDPNIQMGFLLPHPTNETAAAFKARGAYSLHPRKDIVTPEFVQNAHENGLKIFAYTVNKTKDIDRMRQLEIDGVFTDYPSRV